MTKRIILIALAALTLIATGCKKKTQPIDEPVKVEVELSITGAPEEAVLVGEKLTLTLKCNTDKVDLTTAEWSSTNTEVAKVNNSGHVLAVGMGVCEISAVIGEHSASVAISVNERDPSKDQMGHVGEGKTTNGRDNSRMLFQVGDSGYAGEIWHQGGANLLTYYENGTFIASWSGPNDFLVGVGYYYGEQGTSLDGKEYNCYFKHDKLGSGGGYNYICVHGWMVNPLIEFFIIDDWYNKPSAGILGQRKGEVTVDGDTYEIWQNTRVNQPSILGTQTFPQYYSVRKNPRQSGRIHVSTHFNNWARVGMTLGKLYDLRYYVEVGGGSGSLDCTYLFMSDGQI